MGMCVACGNVGGMFLQAGRLDLAICTWLVAALVAFAWIFGDVPARERRLPGPVAWLVCHVNGHYARTRRPGWSWQRCRRCGRPTFVFRRPA
jgi:hypothetical protein